MGEDGSKMSKSLGNIISPDEVVKSHGADILRLWVVGSDYSEDLRIGPEILKSHSDIYRRLRNTLRYVLGNLDGFNEDERLDIINMPELDRWVLHRLWEMDALLRQACNELHFHTVFAELHSFCALDLSAFYFDVRKDSLYCDRQDNIKRRAARTVLDEIFTCLTAWLAPFICFTAEEAWLARYPSESHTNSIHLRAFPKIPETWYDKKLSEKWDKIRALRRVVTGAIELERKEKRIGSSLQAHPKIYASQEDLSLFDKLDAAELFITSGADFTTDVIRDKGFSLADMPNVTVLSNLADGKKCERCWKVLPDVGSNAKYQEICGRCADAVHYLNNDN
jgi:isoleucyl-tRNA synthetase